MSLERGALDGTKVKAHASQHKAMRHGKILPKEKQLDEELRKSIDAHFRKVAETDAEDDRKFGSTNPYLGDPEVKKKADQLRKIEEARKCLAERERAKAKAVGKEGAPRDPKAQVNFPYEDSRIIPDGANRASFVQAYNCQARVDGKVLVIVAAEATQAPQDQPQMVAMVNTTIRNTGAIPQELGADAGFFSEVAIREVEERRIDVHCPPDNGRKTERGACPLGRPPSEETFVQRMRRKVRSEVGRDHYPYRKFVVEPVFSQMKPGRGLRQFLLRELG